MVRVYRGRGPTDAHLLHHWLRRNGIAAEIRGDLLTSRGEIPIPEAMPTVWVPDEHEARARTLVEDFEAPPADPTPWRCSSCQEVNEPTFDSCWNCQTDRQPLLAG